MKKVFSNIAKEISIKTLIASILFLLSVFVFAFLAHEVVGEKEDIFDTKVFQFFEGYTTSQLVSIMARLTFFGTAYFLVPAYSVLITTLFIIHKRSEAVSILILAISSTALMFALKAIYQRSRPSLPLLRTLNNYSFPSGHALTSFVFCGILVYLAWKSRITKTWKYFSAGLLVLFSLAIGISRIILRYHFASDVLAGFSIGFAWVLFFFWIQKKMSQRNQ